LDFSKDRAQTPRPRPNPIGGMESDADHGENKASADCCCRCLPAPVQVRKSDYLEKPRPTRHDLQSVKRKRSVLRRPGSDLLFQVLRLSTIGAGEFNGRVRDGIGFWLPARTTRPAKDGHQRMRKSANDQHSGSMTTFRESKQADQSISILLSSSTVAVPTDGMGIE
jgi:hypothetical protein